MTNAAFSFDTLRYAKKLKAAGYTDAQAEAQAEALLELIEDKLATKQDLGEMETRINHAIKELENRIIIKVGGMIAAGIVILEILRKFI